MSRFKPSPTAATAPVAISTTTPGVGQVSAIAEAPPRIARAQGEPRPALLQTIGFYTFLLYLFSGTLNDWTLRLLSGKSYLSTVTVVALPFLFLMSGGALNGLKTRVGKYWAVFLVLLVLSTPLSVWKGGSVDFLSHYVPRSYILFFYLAAFVISIKQLRTLMTVFLLTNVLLLLTCWKFGSGNDVERFYIPESLFYSNANELALALTLAVTYFSYLFWDRSVFKRAAAAVAILIATLYIFKTGSRGCTLALLVLFGIMVIVSKRKVQVLALAVPTFLTALLLAPSASLHRIVLFTFSSATVGANNTDDLSALGSQVQRQELFKRSVRMTFEHPLLGVGPNMFAVADSGERAKKGEWAAWLGTHNSYTQVSSECGIPAFFCYVAVIVLSTRITFRLYRRTRDQTDRQARQIAALAFTTFCGLVVYAVGTTFFHMAYTGGLPVLAGTAVCLERASRAILGPASDARLRQNIASAPA